MKWIEIKEKTEVELEADLEKSQADLVDLRFRVSSGALKQVHQIGKLRKNIARILTRINQLKTTKK